MRGERSDRKRRRKIKKEVESDLGWEGSKRDGKGRGVEVMGRGRE